MAIKLNGPLPVLAVGGALALLYALKMGSVLQTPERAQCEDLAPAALPKVVMYGTSWCSFCKKTRWYLEDNTIAYCEYDIETSPAGASRYQQLRGRAIPLIMVGSQRLDGYDEKTLRATLRREGLLN